LPTASDEGNRATFPRAGIGRGVQHGTDRRRKFLPVESEAGDFIARHIIAETRQYLRDFNHLNAATTTARELYDAMLEIYPDRVNPGSLWGAANTAKKQA
jgi:hypothetical protein